MSRTSRTARKWKHMAREVRDRYGNVLKGGLDIMSFVPKNMKPETLNKITKKIGA